MAVMLVLFVLVFLFLAFTRVLSFLATASKAQSGSTADVLTVY